MFNVCLHLLSDYADSDYVVLNIGFKPLLNIFCVINVKFEYIYFCD